MNFIESLQSVKNISSRNHASAVMTALHKTAKLAAKLNNIRQANMTDNTNHLTHNYQNVDFEMNCAFPFFEMLMMMETLQEIIH